jgi:uncharacterized protein
MTTRKIPRPLVQPDTLDFWRAADEGRLLLRHCAACGEHHHYPRERCPFCGSAQTGWSESAGTGQVYSFSRMGEGDAAYTLAYVTLDEGPTMLSNLTGPGPFAVGQRVRVVFAASDGGHAVPMFSPDPCVQGA